MSSLIKNVGISQQTSITLNKKVKSDPVADESIQDNEFINRQTEIDAEIALAKKVASDQGYSDGKKIAQEEMKILSRDLYQKYNQQELVLKEQYRIQEQNMLNVAARLEKHNSELAEIFESRLLLLTMQCLYKLAGDKDIYEDIVKENVQRCLSQEAYPEKISIRLPESSAVHFAFLAEALPDNFAVVFEQGLEPGKCLITSGYTTEDVSLLTLLDQIKDQFISTYDANQYHA